MNPVGRFCSKGLIIMHNQLCDFILYAINIPILVCVLILKGNYSLHVLLFRVEYQLPNLIVGAITKESIYGAFENGITAEQVMSKLYYLLSLLPLVLNWHIRVFTYVTKM